MTVTKKIKKYAIILFCIYMFCLFWIVTLKCNLRTGVLDSRYFMSRFTLAERMRFSLGKFTFSDIPDVLVNIVIFIPLGLIFPLIREKKPVLTSMVLGFSISLAAEIFQIISCIGGFAYIDLINNTLGAVLGALLYVYLIKRAKEKPVMIALISAISAGAALSVFAIVNTIINIDIYL